jgi:hypothetical protein
MDMMFGAIVLKARGEPTAVGPRKRRDHIQRCVSIFLNGVVTDKPT